MTERPPDDLQVTTHSRHAPRFYELSPVDLKRVAHAAVHAKAKAHGERIITQGFVNLEVTYCVETNRVTGARVYYTQKPHPNDDPKFNVKVKMRDVIE